MDDRNPITYAAGRLTSEIDHLTILYDETNRAQAKAAHRLMTAHNQNLVASQDLVLPRNAKAERRRALYLHWYRPLESSWAA